MTFKQTLGKVTMNLKKNSPAIFTGVGIVGLGATAYLAYKSRDKVEAVVDEIERKRDLDLPVDKLEVAKGLTEALYQPVAVGAASIACILLAQKIQNNRIKTLIGVVAVEQARNMYFEKKYREQHGDEAYAQFSAPVEQIETVEVDKKGKEKITAHQVKKELDETIGQWYDESSEYVSDDHTYNLQMIESVSERLRLRLFQRGHLILNEVREELGFKRIRNGALLGWSSGDSFDITRDVLMVEEEDINGMPTGESKEQIWVSWSRPRYIYDEVDLTGGRYSF